MISLPQHPQFTVTEAAMRPGDPQHPIRRCFYCKQPVGGIHGPECVLIHRDCIFTATVRPGGGEILEVDFPDWVPWDWDKDTALFKYNEGTWCADNLINRLDRRNRAIRGLMARLWRIARKNSCLCECTTVSIKTWGTEAKLGER